MLKKGGMYKLHNIAIHEMHKWRVYQYFPNAMYEDFKKFWNKEVIFNELKAKGFEVNLTMEYRMKERKKYGLKGARRAPQFSNRLKPLDTIGFKPVWNSIPSRLFL